MKKSLYVSTALAVSLTSLLLACGGGGGNAGTTASVGTGSPTANGGSAAVSSTSPDKSISLRVNTGDKIETTANEIKYRKIFTATVTDTNGTPVKGAKVSVRAEMLGYLKGTWDSVTNQQQIAATCPNEDTNRNNILDAGEDTNGSGELEPRIASIVTGARDGIDITDSQGIVYIVVEYGKDDASWLAYELVVSTSGTANATEVTTRSPQWTGWVEGDESKASNPFRFSRFGTQAGCNNTN